MFKLWLSAAALVACVIKFGDAAKILAITPLASPSHGIWNRALLEALADKGHEITALIPFVGKNRTGLTYYDVGGKFEDDDVLGFAQLSAKENVDALWYFVLEVTAVQIKSTVVKEILLNSKENYDLIIYEPCASESFSGIFSKFKAPIVAIEAYADANWNWDSMGVANYPSVFQQPYFSFRSQMTFWERVQNFLTSYYSKYTRSNYLKTQQEMSRNAFGKGADDLRDVENNFDILLINSGPPGIDLGRYLPPNVKEVGCMHCRPGNAENLPEDVKEFLDNATDGFILFSLGTNVKSNILPAELIQGILKVLGELNVRVLWKFESDSLPGKPANVKISKWLPQQDVLAHKNIRLFITHGGRLSTQEAVFHGVPVIVIPFFADQYLNGERMVEHGVGLRLNYIDFDISTFKNYIATVLNNPSYMDNARRMSVIARDQPETALERAVFWTEYVIRHKGAKHLRPAGKHLNWFQLHSLDVIALLISAVLIPATIVLYILVKIVSVAFKKPASKRKIN